MHRLTVSYTNPKYERDGIKTSQSLGLYLSEGYSGNLGDIAQTANRTMENEVTRRQMVTDCRECPST